MLIPATTTDLSVSGAIPASTQPPARRRSPTRETAHSVYQGTVHFFRASQQPVWPFAIRAVATHQRSVSSFASPRTQEKLD